MPELGLTSTICNAKLVKVNKKRLIFCVILEFLNDIKHAHYQHYYSRKPYSRP